MYKLLKINNPNWIVMDIHIKPFFYIIYIHNIHSIPTLNSKQYQIVIHRMPDGNGDYKIGGDGVYDFNSSIRWYRSLNNFECLLNNLIININNRYINE